MADESGGMGGAAGMGGMMGKMSTGELLMNLGAAWIFIVVYVIGNRIASDYGVSVLTTVSLLSLFVLAATYSAKMDKGGLATWYPWAARTATWAIFILVALDLLNGLAHDFFGSFYETTMYIAAAVGAVGAYMQSQGN